MIRNREQRQWAARIANSIVSAARSPSITAPLGAAAYAAGKRYFQKSSTKKPKYAKKAGGSVKGWNLRAEKKTSASSKGRKGKGVARSLKKRVAKMEKKLGHIFSHHTMKGNHLLGIALTNTTTGQTTRDTYPRLNEIAQCNYFDIVAWDIDQFQAAMNSFQFLSTSGTGTALEVVKADVSVLQEAYQMHVTCNAYSKLYVKNNQEIPMRVDVYVVEPASKQSYNAGASQSTTTYSPTWAVWDGITQKLTDGGVWKHTRLYPSDAQPAFGKRWKIIHHGKHFLQGGDMVTATTSKKFGRFNADASLQTHFAPGFCRYFMVRYQGEYTYIDGGTTGVYQATVPKVQPTIWTDFTYKFAYIGDTQTEGLEIGQGFLEPDADGGKINPNMGTAGPNVVDLIEAEE